MLQCHERPTQQDPPWVDGKWWCLERVIDDNSAGELSFTALAVTDDGTLYVARPLAGEIYAFEDNDGDLLPDTPRLVVDGLTLPNGLAYYDGALYISGGAHIYRWADETLETLVDDLPAGATGFWTGGLTIGPDERIYVATGAACDFCEVDLERRGTIFSFALDGSDRQVVATGLRQPSDVAFLHGRLWTVDTARDTLGDQANLDELNEVTPGAHFGWPYCIGANEPDMPGDFDCAEATAPALSLPTHSTPLGLAAYTSDTFPNVADTLLMVMGGAAHEPNPRHIFLTAVHFDDEGQPIHYEALIPRQGDVRNPPNFPIERLNLQGSGFWPHRPIDVAVSPDGWIYVSVGGGRILALRP